MQNKQRIQLMENRMSLRLVVVLFVLLSYPLFYYAYKYGSPDIGGLKDYYSYVKLYDNWSFSEVESPFNQRLISSFFIFLLCKNNWYYETLISYTNNPVEKSIFFNSLFFNYLSLVGTVLVVYKIVLDFMKNQLKAIGAGVLYLLGFGTLLFSLNGLTESFSYFLSAIIFYSYLKRSKWIFLYLGFAIFQREFILIIVGFLSIFEFLFEEKNKYYLKTFFVSILFFGLYFILRKTFFYTPRYDKQLDILQSIIHFFEVRFPLADYIKQTFLVQNILFIYMGMILYKVKNKYQINKLNLIKVLSFFIISNVISFMAVLGNSTGRYFYVCIPLVIYYLFYEINEFDFTKV